MIRDYQALQRTWFEKGKQRIIRTTGKHRGVKLLSTVDYESGRIVWHEDVAYNAETFLTFLSKVLEAYPSGTITMVLDNARIHHAKLLEPFLNDNKRLTLVFLPPYSPQLNIVEGLWKWLKADVVNNVFYHTVAEIRKNVSSFMNAIMQQPQIVIDRSVSEWSQLTLWKFFNSTYIYSIFKIKKRISVFGIVYIFYIFNLRDKTVLELCISHTTL